MSAKPCSFETRKCRRVYKVGATYAIVGWLLVQLATKISPFFEVPKSALRLGVILAALLLAPFAAQAELECTKAVSAAETLICSDQHLMRLDKGLNGTYQALTEITREKAALRREQRKWLATVRDTCATKECMTEAYLVRADALSARLIRQGPKAKESMTNREAKSTCAAIAKLADDDRLAPLAVLGRGRWDAGVQGMENAWAVTTEENAELDARHPSLLSGGAQIVYRLHMDNQDHSTRFAAFATGGTCPTTQVFNVSYLLNAEKYDFAVDEVPDPDQEIRWVFWGGGDYPIVFRGRNFMITSPLEYPNIVNMISWIKPDGHTRPLCLMSGRNVHRVPLSASPLCSGIATGKIRPLDWTPITEDLPFRHDPNGYRDEFVRRFGDYADRVGQLQTDINDDGVVENLARFEYNSGAGCGFSKWWMSVISKDLGHTEANPLNEVLKGVGGNTLEVYETEGKHYIKVIRPIGLVEDIVALRGPHAEKVCAIGWAGEIVVSTFFDVEEPKK